MKKAVVYTFAGLFVALTITYLVFCIGIANEKRNARPCEGLNIVFVDSTHTGITRGEIMRYMDKEYGKYIGESIAKLDLTKIERIVNAKDAVRNSEAYVSSDGRLNIKITQRTPLVGFQREEDDFYADEEGYIFPLQKRGNGVTMITGNIPLTVAKGFKGEVQDSTQKRWLMETIEMTEYIKKNRLWKEVSYSVNDDGDLVITPEDEDVIFIIGSPEEYKAKFSRVRRYYLGVVPEVGEDYYTSVNVKYAGQLVCRQDKAEKKVEEEVEEKVEEEIIETTTENT